MKLVIRVGRNVYPTTWENLALTCRHVGDIHKVDVVDVWNGNDWFATRFTNRDIPMPRLAR